MLRSFIKLLVSITILLTISLANPKPSYAVCGEFTIGACNDSTGVSLSQSCDSFCTYSGYPGGAVGCSGASCVCDNGTCTGLSDCPVVGQPSFCNDTTGSGADINPYVDCGGSLGSFAQCCSTQAECNEVIPEGPCNPYSPAGDSQCHIDNGGPCDPNNYPDEFWLKCLLDDSTNPPTSYCACSSDEFFGPASSELCYTKSNKLGIDTAIGCLGVILEGPKPDFSEIGLLFYRLGVGMGGGIALILIAYGGFMVMTSSGNPQKLTAGKELITAAISGLFLLVFCGFILRFIGVDIFGLDSFGFGN